MDTSCSVIGKSFDDRLWREKLGEEPKKNVRHRGEKKRGKRATLSHPPGG